MPTASLANPKQSARRSDRDALRRRAADALSRNVHFIANPAFSDMDAAGLWRSELARAETRAKREVPAKSRHKMPAHLERLCDSALLTADEEQQLFRRMNYLKYRANSLRSTLSTSRPSVRKLDQIDALLSKAEAIRNEIVSANTRLVVSIVKKFSDEHNRFDDMLSEGISSLMNAVEKFDYDRGFRFSTYATMVVRRHIYRSMQRTHKNRMRFVTGQLEVLNGQENERELSDNSSQLQDVENHLSAIMKHLDEREKLIVGARYGFVDLGMKATFANLGRKLGISKERVRQLELRAVEKLRCVIGEMGIFNELRSVASR